MRRIILVTTFSILLFSCTSPSRLKEMKEAKQRDEDTKQAQIDADTKEKEQFIFELLKS